MAPRTKTKKATEIFRSSQVIVPLLTAPSSPSLPPSRVHSSSYHKSLLLGNGPVCEKLLAWFKQVEATRNMPWRKEWLNPSAFEGTEDEFRTVLSKRAYEVWVSEIMLQQTRVSTVVPYFNTWISKWPTVQDLATANQDEVLKVWKGLGYYSRASRLCDGAKAMVAQSSERPYTVPSQVAELLKIPGIGKYTAGAISSIAFGEAEPVLDGNVARVLSRQLGCYFDVKDKKSSNVLWEAADQLIKNISNVAAHEKSSIPGQWNQAMMELGSTICTPRPRCEDCPVQTTCIAYREGQTLASMSDAEATVTDIEDACTLCEAMDPKDLTAVMNKAESNKDSRPNKKRKVETHQSNTLSNYFKKSAPSRLGTRDITTSEEELSSAYPETPNPVNIESIPLYCSLFPKKVEKKKVAEEGCVVCMIELYQAHSSSHWLIEQRPAKGLLASLWQFPIDTLPSSDITTLEREALAHKYVTSLDVGKVDTSKVSMVASFPPLLHVFTHLKLTMHICHFRLKLPPQVTTSDLDLDLEDLGPPRRRWVKGNDMEEHTLSTGMRRCWEVVNKEE